jgi:hypothetical protein
MRFTSAAASLGAALTLFAIGGQPARIAAAPSPCEIDDVPRIVAVGDVHGAYDRFVEILQAAQLVDGRSRWIGGHAHLVQLGDIVDRGADSRKALDLLRTLEEQARDAGGAVHALIGNHEVMRMLGDLRYTASGEFAAFVTPQSVRVRNAFIADAPSADRDQVAKQTPLGWVEMRAAIGRRGEYGQWLRSHDVVVRLNGVVFVHGGISPKYAGRSCNDINTTVRRELGPDEEDTRADPLASTAAATDGPLWYRGLVQEPESFEPKFDDILRRQHARAIVVAHTVVAGGRVGMRFGGRLYAIDTGMQPAYVPDGRASALEIIGDAVTAIYTDRKEAGPPLPESAPAQAR